MNRLLLFALLAALSIPAIAAEKAPLPAKLTTAKSAFLVNEGVSARLLDKVYSELKKWNRFRLVESREDADIVITLSRGATSGAFAAVRGFGGGAVVTDISIRITDATDDVQLWADSIDGGHSTWFAGDSIVSHLRKRMENR
jgi:hypothetical protein